jgi:hypothetical protein
MTCNCTKYVVSRNIPIPTDRQSYPFTTMKVGESVFIPQHKAHSAQASAWYASNRYCRKFTSRSRCERGQQGIRIWRVA